MLGEGIRMFILMMFSCYSMDPSDLAYWKIVSQETQPDVATIMFEIWQPTWCLRYFLQEISC